MTRSFHFNAATPVGEAGVAILELFGAGTAMALERVFRPRAGALPGPSRTKLGDFLDLAGQPIDEAIVANVPAEAAWSRLDGYTLSLHGGPWIYGKAIQILEALGGIRLDLRGALELSIRSGGLDAVQAAAFELLVEARTERAARFFVRQHAGELSGRLRSGLEHVARERLDDALALAAGLLEGAGAAARLGDPLRILIAGPPNAGKSTLFNRLVEDERAIVSQIPGTTRDALEESIAIQGFPVVVTDSPGLRPRHEAGEIEREGIDWLHARLHEREDEAVIFLIPHPWNSRGDERPFLDRYPAARVLAAASLSDLAGAETAPPGSIRISALTGEGLEELRRQIVASWIDPRGQPSGDLPLAAFTKRQREILERAASARNLDAVRGAYIECLQSSWP